MAAATIFYLGRLMGLVEVARTIKLMLAKGGAIASAARYRLITKQYLSTLGTLTRRAS